MQKQKSERKKTPICLILLTILIFQLTLSNNDSAALTLNNYEGSNVAVSSESGTTTDYEGTTTSGTTTQPESTTESAAAESNATAGSETITESDVTIESESESFMGEPINLNDQSDTEDSGYLIFLLVIIIIVVAATFVVLKLRKRE